MEKQKKLISAKQDFVFKELMKNETVRNHLIADILDMPAEEIKGSRLLNTFLWQRYHNQKLGILDVLVELKNGTKIDFEIQVRPMKYWDRRNMFYLCKLYTDGIHRGEKLEGASRAITVSLLDFNLFEDEKYHHTFRFQDTEGRVFTDRVEIRVIELKKKLYGKGNLEDWIRLLNAETREELDMIRTQNAGILEAIRELRVMNFGKSLKAWYENRIKYEWDRIGELEYARDQGKKELSVLYWRLKERNRLADFERAMEDSAFREQLEEELGIRDDAAAHP